MIKKKFINIIAFSFWRVLLQIFDKIGLKVSVPIFYIIYIYMWLGPGSSSKKSEWCLYTYHMDPEERRSLNKSCMCLWFLVLYIYIFSLDIDLRYLKGSRKKVIFFRALPLRKKNFFKLYLSYFKTKKSSFCH